MDFLVGLFGIFAALPAAEHRQGVCLVAAAQFLKEKPGDIQLFRVGGADGENSTFNLFICQHLHRFQNVGEVLAGLFLLLLRLFCLAALLFLQPGRGHDGDHAPALGVLF